MRFNGGFNAKSSGRFYKNKSLKKRVSKLNSTAGNNNKSMYIHENVSKRKIDYFNLIYKK